MVKLDKSTKEQFEKKVTLLKELSEFKVGLYCPFIKLENCIWDEKNKLGYLIFEKYELTMIDK